MGQHQIQRQLLRNFSFEGCQPNSRETWHLNTFRYQPTKRSIKNVGFFEVNCSEDVDRFITDLEDGFKVSLQRLSRGDFDRADACRAIYDFIAMHYVRSQACRLQIEHILGNCRQRSWLTHQQAQAERHRLGSHQNVEVFRDLVDNVSRTLTHYVLCPLVMTESPSFLTSNKIMCASTVESDERETFVWFPIAPLIGLCLVSDGHAGQILGPNVEVHHRFGRVRFAKSPEAAWLRCQAPSPQDGNAEFVNTLNGMMIEGSTELYAADRNAMDSALRTAELHTEYQYHPTVDNRAEEQGLTTSKTATHYTTACRKGGPF